MFQPGAFPITKRLLNLGYKVRTLLCHCRSIYLTCSLWLAVPSPGHLCWHHKHDEAVPGTEP